MLFTRVGFLMYIGVMETLREKHSSLSMGCEKGYIAVLAKMEHSIAIDNLIQQATALGKGERVQLVSLIPKPL